LALMHAKDDLGEVEAAPAVPGRDHLL